MKSMKTVLVVLVIMMALLTVSCAKKDKYALAREVILKQVAILEDYVEAMEKADSAPAVAKAINAYSAAQAKLGPAIKEVQEKFPEMKQEEEPPVELKPEMDKLNEVMNKMYETMAKGAQFMNDPEVMEAQQNLQKAMETMR